jgi:hypothetical protein
MVVLGWLNHLALRVQFHKRPRLQDKQLPPTPMLWLEPLKLPKVFNQVLHLA